MRPLIRRRGGVQALRHIRRLTVAVAQADPGQLVADCSWVWSQTGERVSARLLWSLHPAPCGACGSTGSVACRSTPVDDEARIPAQDYWELCEQCEGTGRLSSRPIAADGSLCDAVLRQAELGHWVPWIAERRRA